MQARAESDLFEHLFASEYRGVVAAASRIVGRGAAEDIAQETFVAYFRAGPADAGHARNWLYRTALHRALDLLRSGRRRETRENVFKASESVPNPEDLVQRRELRRDVSRALRRIRTRYAAVLALRYTGFSYKEIAEVIDVNVNQVGTLLLRAEAAFKKEYDRVSSLE